MNLRMLTILAVLGIWLVLYLTAKTIDHGVTTVGRADIYEVQ